MNHVVADLYKIDSYAKSLTDDDRLSKWLSKVLKKEVVTRRDWLTPLDTCSDDEYVREYINISSIYVQMAASNDETVFLISFCDAMNFEVQYVVDWLAELEQRDPRLFAKLDRITWVQAFVHSSRWHEALEVAAEKLANEGIPFGDDCPVMFTHGDGMKWVWLKTDKARDDEGRIMGHCVGQGGYDHLSHAAGVFSLRDVEGRPHVTLELREDCIVQAMMKGNVRVELGSKYSKHALEFQRFMEPLLTLKPKQEGVDHLVWWNGDEEWFENSRRHREDGPAVECANGSREWWVRGFRHREDGPAITKLDGSKEWYRDGGRHREGGPAIIKAKGDRLWYKNGLCHREDGPAFIDANGNKSWWKNGYLHREDGPAVIDMNGDKVWYRHGKLHREDGPAVEREDGRKEWWVNVEQCSEEEYREKLAEFLSFMEFPS